MKATVGDLRRALEDYDDDATVLFVEHQHRGAGLLFRADEIDALHLQRQFSYRPGLEDPKTYVVLNLTHTSMTNDYVPVTGEHVAWPGKME